MLALRRFANCRDRRTQPDTIRTFAGRSPASGVPGSSPWADTAGLGEADRRSASREGRRAHPTGPHTNLPALLEGPDVTVLPPHAKVRPDGYRQPRGCDRTSDGC